MTETAEPITPFVSVVIPTHTGGRLVREAVASVRAQTHENREIIVVCDGCDDPLSEYAGEDRIKVIHQRRSGVSTARNVGARAASGDWIGFLDHDDIMLPRMLELQLAELIANPEAGLCHAQFEIVNSEGVRIGAGHGADTQYEDMLRCNYGMAFSTVLVSRPAFEYAGGFDAKACAAEDVDFLLRVGREYRFAFVPEVSLQRRIHDANTTGVPWDQYVQVDYVLTGYRRYLELMGEHESVALIDKGRTINRRVNAEIAVHGVRASARTGPRGAPGAVKSLVIAARLEPAVLFENARAFIAARRRSRRS